jgi:hypothetical protein
MYHQTEVNLIRDITFVDEVGNKQIEETVICQDCDSREKTKQDKKMYSEEDMREAYKWGRIYDMTSFDEWFEQFKNK